MQSVSSEEAAAHPVKRAALFMGGATDQIGYDLVGAVLVSRAGRARHKDHTRLFDALCELKSRVQIQERRVLAHGVQSWKVRSTNDHAILAARRKVVASSKRSALLSSLASEKTAMEKKPGRKRRRVSHERSR